ncbi:hypothetical protein HaLaN_20859, partial [Haematococcus lacustris]
MCTRQGGGLKGVPHEAGPGQRQGQAMPGRGQWQALACRVMELYMMELYIEATVTHTGIQSV